jgi:hypothetical protein
MADKIKLRPTFGLNYEANKDIRLPHKLDKQAYWGPWGNFLAVYFTALPASIPEV